MKVKKAVLGTFDPEASTALVEALRALRIPKVQVASFKQLGKALKDPADLVILDLTQHTLQEIKDAVQKVQEHLHPPLLLLVDPETLHHLKDLSFPEPWACLVPPVSPPQLEHMIQLIQSQEILLRQNRQMQLLFRAMRNVDRVTEEEETLDQVLEKVCYTLSRMAQYPVVGIWMRSGPGKTDRWFGEVPGFLRRTTKAVDLHEEPPWVEVSKTWAPLTFSQFDLASAAETTLWAQVSLQAGYRSMAAFPILHRNRLQGIFLLFSHESEFLPGEIEILNGIAETLGHVIHSFSLEKEREAIQEAYEALVEQSIQGIAILQDRRFVYVNPATIQILGYSPEELMVLGSEGALGLVHPEDRKTFLKECEDLLTGQIPSVRGEIRARHRNGAWLWLLYAAQSIEYRGRPAVQIFFVDITKQKRMEDRLRQALQEWDSTFQSIGVGISIHRPDGTIVRANKALSELLGPPLHKILGKKCFEVFHQEDHFIKDCPLVRSTQSKKAEELELFDPTLKRHLHITCYPMLDEEDNVEAVIHIVQDVTQEKMLLESLGKSERRYRYFVEQTGEGFYRMASGVPIPTDLPPDEQIQMMYKHMYVAECNDNFAKMYGYKSAKEIVGKPFVELHGSPDVEENIEALRAFIRNGYRVLDVETMEQDKEGNPVYFLNNAVGIIEDGKLVEVWGTQRDITQRKILEQRIHEAERRYRSIFENSIEGIYQTTPDGQFLTANPALARILGYASPEELMSTVREIARQIYVHPEDRKRFEEALQSRGYVRNFVYAARRKDGKIIWLSENARVVRDDQGKVLYYEGMVQDITQQRELQDQLIQAQKMEAIGRVVSGIVHDFNNLLVPILGYAEILEKSLNASSGELEAVKVINEAARQAATLARQLLSFTRRQPSHMRDLELNGFLAEVVEVVQRVIGEDIQLETVYADEPIWCKADRTQLQQVIMNLVINARDAMPKGGRLTLGIEPVMLKEEEIPREANIKPGPYVKLWVQDTGIGMDRETLSRIFEPFFTTKQPGEGTGLGLSTVYGIVKQHRGWIRVSSTPGKGTTFWVFLPRETRKRPKKTSRKGKGSDRSSTLHGSGEWVLVVEDQPQVRALASKILSENGYHVVEASNLAEAEKVFQKLKDRIRILFSDVILPDGTGTDLAEKLWRQNPELQVILASGYADDRISMESMEKRGFQFIPKPYTATVVLEALRQALKSHPPKRHDPP